jgi:predicted DNA binding CopG/RHH family protein
MTTDKDTRYQFRLPSSLLGAALEKARKQDLSLAQVLRRLLREWVEDPLAEDKESQQNQ